MSTFQQAIQNTQKLLTAGQIEAARVALDQAWALAGAVKAQRTVAHDIGNKIQAAIFNQYLASH